MGWFIGFIAGLFVGGAIGFVIMGLLTSVMEGRRE